MQTLCPTAGEPFPQPHSVSIHLSLPIYSALHQMNCLKIYTVLSFLHVQKPMMTTYQVKDMLFGLPNGVLCYFYPGNSWFPLFTSMNPPFQAGQSSFLCNHGSCYPPNLELCPYSEPSLLLSLLEPYSFFEFCLIIKELLNGTSLHGNLPSLDSYKSCKEYHNLTLNLITHWVLHQEAFILWHVWLPTLIFSKMTISPY